MIENTNTKQFYPGPILNNTLEITDFLFNDAEQIKITHTKLNKEGILIDVDLNYPTDYEVTKVLPSDINAAEAALTASTGQIMLKNVKVAAGEKLTVYRVSQIIQDKDYPRTGAFPAATHEGALDYLTMQNQEQQEELNRTLKVPISTGKFNAMVPVPLPNRILRIDENATGFEFVPYDLDERLDTFEKDINTTIEQNKQELLQLQDTFEENFEAETNTKIQDFEEEVNEKIQTVADAADRINTLDEDLAIAAHAATEASKAATEASKAASTATNKANEILSVENQFLNKSQITNCLLEVPQKIKLELNNGVLTLKAGSKVIVPNGAGVFDEVVITKDLTKTSGWNDERMFFWLNGSINLEQVKWCISGGTAPTGYSYMYWYDTTNNIAKYTNDGGTTWREGCSLPFCRCTTGDGVTLSIDQVFNGFGYIGSTVWADKGVKGLMPNGRNEDGSLKNVEVTTTKVTTQTINSTNDRNVVLRADGSIEQPSGLVYNADENKNYNYASSTTEIYTGYDCGTVKRNSDGIITYLDIKQPFMAVDYADYEPAINSKVSKSGDTMTGDLTIKRSTGYANLNLWSASSVSSTVPSAWTGIGAVHMYDVTGQHTGYLQSAQPTNNTNIVSTSMGAKRNISGTNKTAQIVVSVDSSGNALFEFPMCTTKATTTSSAKSNKVAVVTQNYVNGTSWYRVWSDGWKEQGGLAVTHESDKRYTTVTFLKAFSNTNYTVVCSGLQAAMSNSDYGHIYSITNSSVRFNAAQSDADIFWYACGY